MRKSIDFKKYLPYLVAVLAFVLISISYMSPVMQGKRLDQHDKKTHLGMSKEVEDYREATGEEALWTNSMFGGMPAYQISTQYKTNFMKPIHKILTLGLPRPANTIFLYLLGFFVLLLVLRMNPWLALAGSIAWAFSSYLFIILEAGHNTKAVALAYFPMVIAGILLTYRGKYLLGGALTALFVGLELWANHPQISYYLFLLAVIIGAAMLVDAFRKKYLKRFATATLVLLVAGGIGLLPNLSRTWTTLEYSPYTIRGKSELSHDKHIKSDGVDRDYATNWSYGRDETFTLFVPHAKGGASNVALGDNDKAMDAIGGEFSQYRQFIGQFPQYFGDQPGTSGPVYVGAVVFLLLIIGLVYVRGWLKWALLFGTFLSIFLAWGKNWMGFTNFFMDYIPMYDKFRAVSMTLVIAEFTIPLLAFLGLDYIIKNREEVAKNSKKLYWTLGVATAIMFFFYIAPGTFVSFEQTGQFEAITAQQVQNAQQSGASDQQIGQMRMDLERIYGQIIEARKAVVKADALRSFLFVLFSGLLVFLFVTNRVIKKPIALILGIAFLILIDMWAVNKRYLNEDDFISKRKLENPYPATTADNFIHQDQDPNFRVFNYTVSPFNDASTSYHHKSIGGYHGAKLRRYQDVISMHIAMGNREVLNMLNMKYAIQQNQETGALIPLPNNGALGNAWFVKNIQWVNNPDEEIAHIGKVVRIKSLDDSRLVYVYGEPVKADTISQSLKIGLADTRMPDSIYELDLGRLNLLPGVTYVLGNNPADTTMNFISLPVRSQSRYLAERHLEVELIYNFNPATTAVINKNNKSKVTGEQFGQDSLGMIRLVDYKPNKLTYESNSTSDELVVFSEIYYPKGWKVTIDGQDADHFRANYILRAMYLPKGKHTIEFSFEPKSFYTGNKIALAGSILLLLLLGFAIYKEVKSTISEEKAENEE